MQNDSSGMIEHIQQSITEWFAAEGAVDLSVKLRSRAHKPTRKSRSPLTFVDGQPRVQGPIPLTAGSGFPRCTVRLVSGS